MSCKALIAALAAFCLAWPCALGDTVYLQNGKSVEGKIVKLEKDKLQIQTDKGVQEYTREQVKYFSVQQPGPDGKPVVITGMFKPEPIKMPFELESEHYVIKTDTGEQVPKNAAKAMEQLYEAYAEIFNLKAEAQKQKTEIVIFEKQADFQKYAQSLNATPRPDTLGFFRMGTDGASQICTFKRQTGEFHTLSTLYHEATHQFIIMVMGLKNAPPLWVNEGLAVYFENSQWANGKLQTGIIPDKRLALLQQRLRAGQYVHLADLMKRGRDTYDGLCYSEGWSLVYFFVKANHGAYAKRFGDYFRALRDGVAPDEAFKTHITGDLDKLEKAWKKFCLELKAPAN